MPSPLASRFYAENTYIRKAMEGEKNMLIQKAVLKWLMRVTLVLVLISFSGAESTLNFSRTAIARVEFMATTPVDCARTVSFEKASDRLSHPFSRIPDQTRNFISCLLEYKSDVNVGIKRSSKVLALIKLQVNRLLKFYAYTNSGDSSHE